MIKSQYCKIFLLWLLAVLLYACADDDTFTTSSHNLLSFSTDTVRLDTTFSRVPTTTKTFWVYNRSGDGIRCTNIRLQKGNQTGFRVNVDGIYLGATQGYQVNDIDIRNKDSVRVFVELTSSMTNKAEPVKLEDDLIFTLESGVQQKVNLNAYSWDADLVTNLRISKDTTISSTKPIVIYGGVVVDSSAVLTIGAGTTLYFHENAGIDVYGKLLAKGTADNNVVFRGDRIDHMFDYLPYDRVTGQWQGIHFHSSSYDNELSYTDIHSTYHGIRCDSSDVSKLKLTLYNSIVHNCQGYGLLSTNCVIDIYNTQLTNTLNDCLCFIGGGAMLRHCTLAQFYPFDANRGVALRFGNYSNDISYPLHQFEVYNTIVTGYADNVVMGEFVDSVSASYLFDYCLLRTPEDTTSTNPLLKDIIYEDPKDTIHGGDKNFRMIDIENLKYDFCIDSLSLGRDAGIMLPHGYSEYDRLGIRRDEKPDFGCYEYVVNPLK